MPGLPPSAPPPEEDEIVARPAVDVWPPRASTLAGIVVSMRPRQWIKNLVVFAALIFAKKWMDLPLAGRAAAAFGLFCCARGGVYIINDLFDADRHRKHPLKARRPIASKALGTLPAVTAAILLLTGSLMAGFALSPAFGAVLLAYVAINLAYSFWLKEVVIIDVMVIASGFVLRAVAGALIIKVEISPLLVLWP